MIVVLIGVGLGLGISAGVAALGTGANAIAQGKMNRRAERFNREMFEKQGQRELEYWRLQNEYNSPIAQMQRLQDAGLNPNLVYGNGADAQGAKLSAGGAPSSPNFRAPNLDFSNVVDQMLAVKSREAQIKQIEAQTQSINNNNALSEFDVLARKAVGQDEWNKQAIAATRSMTARQTKEVREFETWLNLAFDGSTGDIDIDSLGVFPAMTNNTVQAKAMKAGLMSTIENLRNIKAGVTLRDDQHKLNQVELELRKFSEQLQNIGLSKETAPIVSTLIRLIFGGK